MNIIRRASLWVCAIGALTLLSANVRAQDDENVPVRRTTRRSKAQTPPAKVRGRSSAASKPTSTRKPSLFKAARAGDIATLEKLLADGASPNATENTGDTLLHAGAKYPEIVKLLLRKGAGANTVDAKGRTPLIAAASAGYILRMVTNCEFLICNSPYAVFSQKSVRGEYSLNPTPLI